LRAVEHAEVVEWTATTEIGLGKDDVISGGFEDVDRGFGGRRQEIVIEGVGPEKNQRSVRTARIGVGSTALKPGSESFRGEGGNAALRGNAGD
jgi:hypothetical protein